jgi:hypothetical protein
VPLEYSRLKILATAFGLVASGLVGCSDACSEYSDYSCDEIAKATYNVHFVFPDSDRDYMLGTVSGLSACGTTAYDYAASKGLREDSGWSYVCCMKTEKSDCAEKHR